MKAITLPSFGGPDALTPAEVPDPKAGPGEVVVDVVATSVNRADVMQRLGHYPPPPGAPPYPGLECAGRISALGTSVTGWQVGDEVCALLAGGGYAERVAVPAGQLLPVPAGLSVVEAAALPEVVATVWSNVFMLAGLTPGETFCVHGGSSGIGTTAIQLAARHGARVFCTAGTEAKLARCRDLGAEVTVNYRQDDFVARFGEATEGRGVGVILDNMGAAYLARNIEALATGGRLVVVGFQGGRTTEVDLGTLMARRASITVTSLRARPVHEKAAIMAAVGESVWPAIETGQFRPVIDRVLPLTHVAEAHRALEASEHIGKIVLTT